MTATIEAPPTTPVITIARSALRTAIGKLMAAVDTSSRALPVVQHIRVEAKDGVLILSATNFEAWVRLTLSCELDGAGVALLPAKMLAEIVANLPNDGALTIRLGTGKDRTIITAGRSRFEVSGLPADEFPTLPEVASHARIVVHSAPFLAALTGALPHTSDADSRPALQGVYVETEDGNLLVVGCDSASLARLSGGTLVPQTPATNMPPCLIHRAGVPILSRLFADLGDDATLTIGADAGRIEVSSGNAAAQVRLVDHQYPNYRQLLTSHADAHRVVCDRHALAQALKRVSIAAAESGRVEMTLDDDLSIRGTQDGSAASDVVALDVHDRPHPAASMRFAMSAALFGRALATIDAERVEITGSAPERAFFLRGVDQPASDPTLLLVMPSRLF